MEGFGKDYIMFWRILILILIIFCTDNDQLDSKRGLENCSDLRSTEEMIITQTGTRMGKVPLEKIQKDCKRGTL